MLKITRVHGLQCTVYMVCTWEAQSKHYCIQQGPHVTHIRPCTVNQFASVLKNIFRASAPYYFRWKSKLKFFVVNGPGLDTQINALFIDIWSFEWLVCSVCSSFFARNHTIVSCYAMARPGISARSNRRLTPFMWKALWQWRLIRL